MDSGRRGFLGALTGLFASWFAGWSFGDQKPKRFAGKDVVISWKVLSPSRIHVILGYDSPVIEMFHVAGDPETLRWIAEQTIERSWPAGKCVPFVCTKEDHIAAHQDVFQNADNGFLIAAHRKGQPGAWYHVVSDAAKEGLRVWFRGEMTTDEAQKYRAYQKVLS